MWHNLHIINIITLVFIDHSHAGFMAILANRSTLINPNLHSHKTAHTEKTWSLACFSFSSLLPGWALFLLFRQNEGVLLSLHLHCWCLGWWAPLTAESTISLLVSSTDFLVTPRWLGLKARGRKQEGTRWQSKFKEKLYCIIHVASRSVWEVCMWSWAQ